MICTLVMFLNKKELKVNTNNHKIFLLHYHLRGHGDVLSVSLCGLYIKWFPQLTINQYCVMKKRYLFLMNEMDLKFSKVLNSKLMNFEKVI